MSLKEFDISVEDYREYSWLCPHTLNPTTYRIEAPQQLFLSIREDGSHGSTHRVVDSEGITHCIPAVGVFGCVLRWKNMEGATPVNF